MRLPNSLKGAIRISSLFDMLTSLASPVNSLKSIASGDTFILLRMALDKLLINGLMGESMQVENGLRVRKYRQTA